jgi:sterol desaturase/sphingolipid hydroxylase (fatty acid hydroxylase superfamily)
MGILWAFPLAFVNVPPEIVFVTGLLTTILSRFQHTNMDLILGPFDYIFSTPTNHRYHHSKNINESNSNYGGDVVLWDHLFGTFHLPKGKKPSDDIGIADFPNYPQDWNGLMLAPFRYKNLKDDAQKVKVLRKAEAMNKSITGTQNPMST